MDSAVLLSLPFVVRPIGFVSNTGVGVRRTYCNLSFESYSQNQIVELLITKYHFQAYLNTT